MVRRTSRISQHILHFVYDLYFDTSIAQICTRVQSVERFLQRKPMADQWFEIEDAAGQTLQTGRPRIAVPIDELEVDL